MRKGFSVIELLVVLAVLAVIFAIGAFNGRRTLLSQEQAAFCAPCKACSGRRPPRRQAEGKTSSSTSRGNARGEADGRYGSPRLGPPPGVSLSLTPGVVAQFTPPGKVADQDGRNLLQPLSFTATVGSKTYTYTVSLIGETEVVP